MYQSFNLDNELANVNPVKALTSGKITKNDIGKTVYLSNTCTSNQEWRIADINHDNTTGTVDLFPKYIIDNNVRAVKFHENSQYYKKSDLRTYLNDTIYNGFTDEVKNAMKVQNFPSNGETLSDKVKCPSVDELGLNYRSNRNVIVEGTIYPIFGTQQLQSGTNSLAIFELYNSASTNADCQYWTRSRYYISNDTSSDVFEAKSGFARYRSCSAYSYPVACIRF